MQGRWRSRRSEGMRTGGRAMGKRLNSCAVIEEVSLRLLVGFFFFQAEDGIRDVAVTGVQTCALPISVFIMRVDADRVGFGLRNAVGPTPIFPIPDVTVDGQAGGRGHCDGIRCYGGVGADRKSVV